MTKLNDIQRWVADTYDYGEFAHVESLEDAKQVGDTLFLFLLYEAADVGDMLGYRDRLDTAFHQLDYVRTKADVANV